jgi:hypothetical protein
MYGTRNELYLHLVWATWDRLPLGRINSLQQRHEVRLRKLRSAAPFRASTMR